MEQVNFQDNGTKVTAVNTKTYIFQRNMSQGPESDLIRTVNIPAIVSQMLYIHELLVLFDKLTVVLSFRTARPLFFLLLDRQ